VLVAVDRVVAVLAAEAKAARLERYSATKARRRQPGGRSCSRVDIWLECGVERGR
jgi:hypothetical protein